MGKTQDDLDVMREHNVNVFSRASTRGTVDLAVEAVENLLAENQFDPDSIDLIVYFHSLPSSTEAAPKSVISEIRSRTGIKADGFSVSQVRCASFSVALSIIERIFKSPHSSVETVLVIGADVVYAEEYRAISRGDMEGDGAVAALIHKEDRGTNVYITNMLFEGQYYAAFKWNNGKLQGPAAVQYRTTGT
jgi:3-oxoacyl-[acyl-carrier-protein] synthase-3